MVKKINPFETDDFIPFAGFPADALRFLRDLKKNNNREWFTENKQRYEKSLKEPMESLLGTLARKLRAKEPDIVIEARSAMYRIYRDIRFSKDKTPYKTHVAAAFTYRGHDRKVDAAFYFHITPEEVGIGGGLYAPASDTLKHIRAALAVHADAFRKTYASRTFKELFGGIEGEELTRVPKGFDADHPEADLLRMKQFLCWKTLDTAIIHDDTFTDILVQYVTAMAPFVRWLAEHS